MDDAVYEALRAAVKVVIDAQGDNPEPDPA